MRRPRQTALGSVLLAAACLGLPAVASGSVEICDNGIDDDGDGAVDIADLDCRPLDLEGLVFAPGSTERLTWSLRTGIESYGLYRGRIHGDAAFDERLLNCLGSELSSNEFLDGDRPLPGDAFYYVVGGIEYGPDPADIQHGALGVGSDGVVRRIPPYRCGRRVFVDAGATGAGTGLSWSDAYATVSDAVFHGAYGLEVWIAGALTDADAALDRCTGIQLLGGFAGTEQHQWQRSPEAFPTSWTKGSGSEAFSTDAAWQALRFLRIDGIDFTGSGSLATLWCSGEGCDFGIHNCSFDGFDTGMWMHGPTLSQSPQVRFENSSFRVAAPASHALEVVAEAWTGGRLTVDGCTFEGPYAAALRYEVRLDSYSYHLRIDVTGSRFVENETSIEIDGHPFAGEPWRRDLEVDLRVGSSAFVRNGSDALRLKVTDLSFPDHDYPRIRAIRGAVIGNTFVDGAADGIALLCERGTELPERLTVSCSPDIWDNIFVGMDGTAIVESDDNEAMNHFTDPTVVGNDFHGNGAAYLDEGLTSLASGDEVNLLPEAWDNFSLEPRFVDPWLDDFRLDDDSPCIDRGHADAPWWWSFDFEGGPRIRGAAPDVGADEAL